MVKMKAPAGVTQVSVEQQIFKTDKSGNVTIPEVFIDRLTDIGFKPSWESITVTQSTADALKAAVAEVDAANQDLQTAEQS